MKRLLLTIIVLLISPASALDSTSLYINDPLKWELVRRPDRPGKKFALGHILVIYPNGDLAEISGSLYRTDKGLLQISYSEGFSLSSGTWEKAGQHLSVRTRTIHSSAKRLDGTDQQYKEMLWSYVPSRKGDRLAERINISGVRYIPLRNLNDPNALAELIRFCRKEAEASK